MEKKPLCCLAMSMAFLNVVRVHGIGAVGHGADKELFVHVMGFKKVFGEFLPSFYRDCVHPFSIKENTAGC